MTVPSRKLLLVCCVLPQSLEKSAHMLILREMVTLGWDVTVLTVQQQSEVTEVVNEEWQGVRLLRVPCQSCIALKSQSRLKRLLSMQSFPDRYASAVDKLLAHALQLHVEQSFDIVLSLYHPMSSHQVARKFSQKVMVPWVAMTKDFYSWPQHFISSITQQIINRVKRRYEKPIYQSADMVLAINNQMTVYLHQLVPTVPIKTLRHCYDEKIIAKQRNTLDEKKTFRLVTIGLTDIKDRTDIFQYLSVVAQLLQEKRISPERFRIRFVGHRGQIVAECAQQLQCESIIEIIPQLSYEAAIQELANATCLFFPQVAWGSRRRLADYIGARKPILAYPEYPGVLSDKVLKQYGAARIASDPASLKAAILDFYQQFKKKEKLDLPVNEKLVNSFSSHYRAEELNCLLCDLLQKSTTKELVDAS